MQPTTAMRSQRMSRLTKLLLPAVPRELDPHSRPLVETGRAGRTLRIDDQPRPDEAAPSELCEGYVEQRETQSATAPRSPDTELRDRARLWIAARTHSAEEGSGDLAPLAGNEHE